MKMNLKVNGMLHSAQAIREFTIIEDCGNNKYVALTENGIRCTAIFNIFTCMYYADDIYGILN